MGVVQVRGGRGGGEVRPDGGLRNGGVIARTEDQSRPGPGERVR